MNAQFIVATMYQCPFFVRRVSKCKGASEHHFFSAFIICDGGSTLCRLLVFCKRMLQPCSMIMTTPQSDRDPVYLLAN